MKNRMSVDERDLVRLAASEKRLLASDARAWDRMGEQLERIDTGQMIGQLCRQGKTVFYFAPAGRKTYFESPRESEVKHFIMRSRWV